MFKIQGAVASLETGKAIPNLQVVLYDLDDPGNKDQAQTRDAFVVAGTDAAWTSINGDRLGSVLTDSHGRFELEVDAGSFAARENSAGPELMLFLLAPEDVDARQPYAFPVTARLLYATRDVRYNAGQIESYYIRLPQAKLEKFRIDPLAAPARPEASAKTLKQEFARSESRSQAVHEAITGQARDRLQPVMQDIQRTYHAFSNFSLRKPSSSRNYDAILRKGESLPDKMVGLIGRRIDEIVRWEFDATRRFVLRVPASTLLEWGAIDSLDASSAQGVVPHRRLLAWYRAQRRGVSLEAEASWMRNYCLRHEARERFDAVVARCGAGTDTGPGSEPQATSDTDTDIAAQVRAQLSTVTTPEQHLSYGVSHDGPKTVAVIHAGAADVTAYHDFHDLQIAFEHVWAESADRSLQPFLLGVYREMVRYQNRVSGTEHYPDVADVDDMRRLYEEFKGLQQMIQQSAEPNPEEYDAGLPLPAVVRVLAPQLTTDEWSALSDDERAHLLALASEFMQRKDYDSPEEWAGLTFDPSFGPRNEARLGQIRSEAQALASAARQAARERAQRAVRPGRGARPPQRTGGSRLAALMSELDERLGEPYRFDVFAPDSVNYGVMLTYRQTWEPRDYQVGELVSTIPLAPKEVRRYSKRQVVRRNRMQKEIEDVQTSRSSESTHTSRADAEIVHQARSRTSFEQTANAKLSVGIFEGEFGTRFGVEAEKSSSDTKRNFREAVSKAAEEYKRQRRLEIETTDSSEFETTSGGEISNPNDEITVTYLFYELQRQYLVSERMQRMTPVVMVAREVPSPDEVDEDWLIAHDWILRRALLDESQQAALDYLATSLVGDELALEAHRGSMQRQVDLVEELTRKEQVQTELSQQAFAELKRLMRSASTPDDAQKMKDIGLAMVLGPFSLAGGNGDDRAAEKREEIAKLSLERADKSQQEASAKLTREVTAMQESVERYTRALQAHFDRMAAIARLRVHVKENILHYMQAIWDHEPADQRYFGLYNLEVPWLEENDLDLAVRIEGRRLSPEELARTGGASAEVWFEIGGRIPLGSGLGGGSPSLRRTQRKLSDVADLDRLLGYKGNYQIFPLKETTYLHDYMMQDYLDPTTGGLRDPDGGGRPPTDDILDYVCCLRRHDPARLDAERDGLLAMIEARLAAPVAEKQLIVVPSDSLYVEALPGKHPIMEDFKLVHRALDVKKVQAEVRGMELENLRHAARLLAGERGDPDIQTRIEVAGNVPVILPTDG